jgi:Flp pilus assembly pilin Flp
VAVREGSDAPHSCGVRQEEWTMPETTRRTEEFRITGEELLAKVKELVNEGNIRRLVIKNEEGATLIEIPVTLGVIGALLLPVWAAIGALAAVATRCTIVVERRD